MILGTPDQENMAIQMVGIYKYFGPYCALENVNLDVKKGTMHAILGENGAGKSTLMNILYGMSKPDAGQIFINGKLLDIKHPKTAIENKIGMVHQHFMLVPTFTVAQNIMLGKELTNPFGILDFKKANRVIEELSEKYNLLIDTKKKIENMSVGMQQRVEILKALYREAEILILDEPTTVLTPQEVKDLMLTLKTLAQHGKTVVIITHKLNEIKQVCDFCTIIRRGKNINSVNVNDYSEQQLASMMVGYDMDLKINKTKAIPKDVVFEIDNLTVLDDRGIKKVNNLSLKIRSGEIFGIAGVDDNGQRELVEAITSLKKVSSGTIKIKGQEIQNTTPQNVIASGIATIPEDRHKEGLVMNFSVTENLLLKKYKENPLSKHGRLNKQKINDFADSLIKKFDIRPPECKKRLVRKLSGGNQQKLIIAREVSEDPDLLVAVQPTRGLDVGAMEYVHRELLKQRDLGKAVLLISLDLNEIIDVADKIAVIYNGNIVKTFESAATNENEIGILMAGGGK